MPDTVAARDSDTTPADAAWAVAEAVRELNLGTLALPGPADPGEAHAALGALGAAAERLPQGLGQLADALERAVEAGALRAVSGAFAGDVPAAAATAGEWLDRAAAAAGQLARALANARFAVNCLTAVDPADDPE